MWLVTFCVLKQQSLGHNRWPLYAKRETSLPLLVAELPAPRNVSWSWELQLANSILPKLYELIRVKNIAVLISFTNDIKATTVASIVARFSMLAAFIAASSINMEITLTSIIAIFTRQSAPLRTRHGARSASREEVASTSSSALPHYH